MPSIVNASAAGEFHGRMLRQERLAALTYSRSVIDACITTQGGDQASQLRLQKLSNYLGNRRLEVFCCSSNAQQIQKRSLFIEQLIPLINGNSITGLLEKLKEENIQKFKGYFSQRFYDELVAIRNELSNPKELTPVVHQQVSAKLA